MQVRDLLIVGAGPSGLATAIAAGQHGLDYEIVEKGVLVNSIYHFPVHMVFFTTPELLEIGNLPLVTPYDKPTRIEALRYYRRVADRYKLQVSFGETVTGLRRDPSTGILTVETRVDRVATGTSSTGARSVGPNVRLPNASADSPDPSGQALSSAIDAAADSAPGEVRQRRARAVQQVGSTNAGHLGHVHGPEVHQPVSAVVGTAHRI